MSYTPQAGNGQFTSREFRLALGVLLLFFGAFLVPPKGVQAGEKPGGGPKASPVVPTLVDSAGRVIGVADLTSPAGAEGFYVMMQIGGVPTVVLVSRTEFMGARTGLGIYFESTDCQGTPLFKATDFDGRGTVPQAFAWASVSMGETLYVPKTDPSQMRSPASWLDPNGCHAVYSPEEYIEGLTFPLSIFNVFVPPFTLTGLRTLP